MQAMTFIAPPQALHVSMSILKTRLSRCAHVIDARRCAGVAGSSATLTLLPLPRFAGVTNARCRLLGDGVRQLRELLSGGRLDPAKPGSPIGTVDVHPIEEQHVKVDIQIERRAKALDEGDRARVGCPVGMP